MVIEPVNYFKTEILGTCTGALNATVRMHAHTYCYNTWLLPYRECSSLKQPALFSIIVVLLHHS